VRVVIAGYLSKEALAGWLDAQCLLRIDSFLVQMNVVVIGTVDIGENLCRRRSPAVFLFTGDVCGQGTARGRLLFTAISH
jgi:hypothetical protein